MVVVEVVVVEVVVVEVVVEEVEEEVMALQRHRHRAPHPIGSATF